MKTLFAVWILIVMQVVNPAWWPSSVVGTMPSCTNPKITLTSFTCDNQSGVKVFTEWWSQLPVQPTPAQISNGF